MEYAAKRRFAIAASYASLALIAYGTFLSINIHFGVLAVIPLLFIAYYTRTAVALPTAVACGFALALLDDDNVVRRGTLGTPPLLDAVVYSASLCAVVLIAKRLREMSIANVVLQGRLVRQRRAAERDVLTGIPNRAYFLRCFRELLQRPQSDERIALLFCDLDGFKAVNDLHGHIVGDRVLALAAGRLTNAVRANDLVARLGGDEFGILAPSAGDRAAAAHMAAQIEHAFADPFHVDDERYRVGITVGVSLYPDDGRSLEALLDTADARMYRAKHAKSRA